MSICGIMAVEAMSFIEPLLWPLLEDAAAAILIAPGTIPPPIIDPPPPTPPGIISMGKGRPEMALGGAGMAAVTDAAAEVDGRGGGGLADAGGRERIGCRAEDEGDPPADALPPFLSSTDLRCSFPFPMPLAPAEGGTPPLPPPPDACSLIEARG